MNDTESTGSSPDGMTMTAGSTPTSRALTVVAAVVAAVVVNLIVYAIGRAAGGSFTFTPDGEPVVVGAMTVAAFSALPMLVGLTAVALLARFGWVKRTAMIVGPVLAAGTILVMTLPQNLDGISKTALSVCHLTLIPIILAAVPRLATASTRRGTVPAGR